MGKGGEGEKEGQQGKKGGGKREGEKGKGEEARERKREGWEGNE